MLALKYLSWLSLITRMKIVSDLFLFLVPNSAQSGPGAIGNVGPISWNVRFEKCF